MKNYDELTNDLLERRDRYVADQKKKRKSVMGVATSLCCFCLVALFGFGMWHGESPDNPAANNKIVINTINGISADRMNIALMEDDFIKTSPEEMCEYYGVDYIPDVPADIKPWPDQRSGIYKRNGGTGEVYWDTNILNYSNEDYTRNINMEISKGRIPFLDYVMFSVEDKTSVINNWELKIGMTDEGRYYTEFLYKDVGFIISAEGLTQDEFVSVVASILE